MKRRNRQKGGFIRKLTKAMIELWKNPHAYQMDCCPCVFTLLGMPLEQARILAQTHGSGFSAKGIIDGFTAGYPDFTFTFPAVDYKELKSNMNNPEEDYVPIIEGFFSEIPSDYATVAGFEREDGTKHCIVLGRDTDGKIMLLDAQAGKGFRGAEAIYDYFERNNTKNIFVLNSKSHQGGQLVINTTSQGESKASDDDDVVMTDATF